MSLFELVSSKWREFGSFHKLYVGFLLFLAYNKKHISRPKRTIRKIVLYYRICDKGYPKEKPDYITKENCVRNALKVFPPQEVEWHVMGDNISDDTYKMLLRYFPDSTIERVSVGNGAGTFRLVYEKALSLDDDVLVYFLEDDYLHIDDSLNKLKSAAESNYTDYFTLYDHPDKYGESSNPYVIKGGESSVVYWCDSRHWKETNSTTMTFAAFVDVLKKDKKVFWRWTERKHPWDFNIFTDLRKVYGRSLSCPIPSLSTHGESAFLANGIEWSETIDKQ